MAAPQRPPAGRPSIKGPPGGYGMYQQRRREAALSATRAARDERLAAARALAGVGRSSACASGALDDGDARPQGDGMAMDAGSGVPGSGESGGGDYSDDAWAPGDPPPGALGGAELKRHYARQLMLPEWMTDVPPDLGTSWLLMPRPEGRRCLVIAAHGITSLRTRTGSLLARCQSALPGGARGAPGAGPGEFSVVDAVLVEGPGTARPTSSGGGGGSAGHGSGGGSGAPGYAPDGMQVEGSTGGGTGGGCCSGVACDGAMTPAMQVGPGCPSDSGGGARGGGGGGWSLAPGSALYVTDVLAWRGVVLAGCSAECRAFWLAGKVAEEACGGNSSAGGGGGGSGGDSAGAMGTQGSRAAAGSVESSARVASMPCSASGGHTQQSWLAVRVMPVLSASPEGLEAVARGSASGRALGFMQDGLLLLHRESHYAPGSTPLALLWKDSSCSRYALDTDAAGVVPERQSVVLRVAPDGNGVDTGDEPPLTLARLPPAWVARMGPQLLRPGRLLRFSLLDGGLRFDGAGRPAGADLRYEGPANARRGRADAFSKMLFQALARSGDTPSLAALQAAALAGCGSRAASAQLTPSGGGGGHEMSVSSGGAAHAGSRAMSVSTGGIMCGDPDAMDAVPAGAGT